MNAVTRGALPPPGWLVEDLGPDTVAEPDAVARYASRFGTISDRDGGSVWPIAARASSGTFSMTAAAAPLHTDAQYRDHPEDAFILACVRPATVDGDTVLLTVAELVDTLASRHDWPELEAALTAPLWQWRTPAVFDGPETNSPTAVLSWRPDSSPLMRWRYDNLVQNEEHACAAKIVADVASTHPATRIIRLEAGQVLVCDNAAVLHGRTAFTDHNRMLWRVRVHR